MEQNLRALTVNERALELFKQSGVQCSCSWPAEGHDYHAPECDVEAEWDRCYALAEDEVSS